ncbi:MbcA/ParS/Xre antitoxin family protein [Thioalkalivibrio thiocyanodenitrificans]|uniref:MbcA/ParS/Xre antitoxin family protein n=1 Tax=Thioalkalivibrio thiocyanodenitrificans TaxID=243063 RepID=UPI0003635FE6|nr:antitoxin Xre-like helix-turn-helix domain-containing protein [Thioalkalivibrio thiocyanodenitrificans]
MLSTDTQHTRHSPPTRAQVLTKAVLRAADLLGLKRSQLGAAIGLSPATLSRMHAGKYQLDPGDKSWELALLLVRLYRGLDALMGGDERSLQAWMRNPNKDLHEAPVNMIGQVADLARLVAYVDAHRARV